MHKAFVPLPQPLPQGEGSGTILASNIILIFLCLLFLSGTALAALSFPALTGRVVDDAGILSEATKQNLTQMLAAHEAATTNQVVVVTLKSLQGTSIEDYGYQLGRFWGIGQKGKDNGALLIVAPKEHKVRIEVGYGLEGTLTDEKSSEIIHGIILPEFRAGHMQQGIVAGTSAILNVLQGKDITSFRAEEGTDSTYSHTHEHPNGSDLINAILILGFICILFMRACWNISPRTYRTMAGMGLLGTYGSGFGGSFGGGGGFSGGGGGFGGGGCSGGW